MHRYTNTASTTQSGDDRVHGSWLNHP